MEVEDDVELTHVAEVSVEQFNVMVHRFKDHEFIIFLLHTSDKVERGISLEHELEVHVVEEVS